VDFAEAAARNEEVVRSVNVRIDEAAEQHNVSAPLPFHCECSDASCVEKLSVAPEEYQRILDERFHFIVIPGHENDGVERVVASHANYLVVEKTGEARAQIERDHPQARHRRPPDAR
jgi:RES domain-containing protein